MHFSTKNYLKNNHYYTPKHPLSSNVVVHIQRKLDSMVRSSAGNVLRWFINPLKYGEKRRTTVLQLILKEIYNTVQSLKIQVTFAAPLAWCMV
jgi:hypothetical protein